MSDLDSTHSEQHPAEFPKRTYRPARSGFRDQSHRSAHEPDEQAQTLIPPAHPLIPQGEPVMVSNQPALLALVDQLRGSKQFAYDSEFIGEMTYIPKLCLIQVASIQTVSLIDPLAELDLTPFWELICDPAIEKIVHAGSQDLEPVFRHMNDRSPANVFDTQVAAGFIRMAYPASLSKLVREIVNVPLGKGLTFTHWDQRPLSVSQVRYAADDVRYLLAARDEIGRRLEKLGHTQWAMAECATLCDPSEYQFDPEHQYRRIRGATSLNPLGMAVLKELVIWRDTSAREHDIPPRSFLRDEILLDLAKNPVRSVDQLARVRGLPRPVEIDHGSQIIAAMQRASALPQEALPLNKQREEMPAEKFRADALWCAIEAICIGRGIDPNLVANRNEVGQLHRHLTYNDSAADLRLLCGWRKEAVVQPLLAMIQGNATGLMRWSEDSLDITFN